MRKLIRKIPLATATWMLLKRMNIILQYCLDYRKFRKLSAGSSRFTVSWRDRYPCLDDRTAASQFDRHYVYHTAWAARILAQTRPEFHVDISSYTYFSAMVSAFIPVRYYDYRPADLRLDNLIVARADLLDLPFGSGSIKSLSCMHVLEHIGLGRYGDSLDPDGDLKAIAQLKRVLAADGSLLVAVPIGRPKLMFNGHRIYSYDQIMEYFSDLELADFSLIPDSPQAGGLIPHAARETANNQTYGCGCFWFRKGLV
ncbi:MAG: DUF268 domain-containing protein [Nitrospirae bacterium]|nr:DUF268 domain-containing protein [Nitrospirota bacterium]